MPEAPSIVASQTRTASNGPNLLTTMLVLVLVGGGMFMLGRWTARQERASQTPPPRETLPTAPGPDNSITTLPPRSELEGTKE